MFFRLAEGGKPSQGERNHMAQIDAFFQMLHELGGSDLHLSSGSQPIVRISGEVQRVKYKSLDHDEIKLLRLVFQSTE